ncbi:ATP-binding protein [Reichenbachiella carrageenanivorans]|uniref:histidine kinase n=1 Tax=Reichenbachiella carrageenanivorans TaxID=2979869 RepID=A0ABY6CV37_9BACT|nr:ATP-binding protein [Reichenbachiella carrageenanivorans]UXX77792.1 ATP-binding protein [Reichenbachiella carrageenanivorans]
MNNSITKIWIIIVVLALTYGSLIFWGAKSYRDSSASIESIIRPDEESNAINFLYRFIVQSDLHFNNFILTGDSLQWHYSLGYTQEVDSLLLQMEQHTGEYVRNHESFDTLKAIIAKKSRINAILIELKQKENSHFFTEQALIRIKRQLSDSVYVDKAITRKGDLVAKRDTLEHVDVVKNPDSYKGLSGLFRKVFGKERIEIDTIITWQEQINYGLEVSIDSSIVRDYYVDTTLALVKTILIDVLDEEVRLQTKLHATELELITYNELLLRNIRSLLNDIALANENRVRTEQILAKQKIEKANTQFLIIAGVGICMGFVLLFILSRDITRTNLYRGRLEKEKERAEQLAAAKEIFLSKMSHEIRTPLHSISGFTHLLDKEIINGKQRKFLSGISHANHYLNELISNILEQAKINAGIFKQEMSSVYIPDLCHEIKLLFKLRMEEQLNLFELNYSRNLSAYSVLVDGIKLKQVLINLLSNAFKYTTAGKVSLEFELLPLEENYELKVVVADTGMGIAPEDRETIFQPFNQISNLRPDNVSGTGLGLSISKHIVEQFGGHMHLESEVGKGSVFTLTIPVTSKRYEKHTETVESNEGVYYPIRVLAVEDDKWNAYLLENYLSAHLNEIKWCSTALDALQILKSTSHHYDLILTDLNLPQMDGRTFFRQISDDISIPVIALSASLGKEDYDALIQLGFAHALGKPFDQKDLLDAIDGLFESQPRPEKHNRQEGLEIDWSGVVGFLEHSSVEIQVYCREFTSSFESKVKTFEQAIDSDLKELGRMAHQLKSNCEQIGIMEFSEELHSIELFSEMRNKSRAYEEAKNLLPKLTSILAKLQSDLMSD